MENSDKIEQDESLENSNAQVAGAAGKNKQLLSRENTPLSII